MGCWLTKSALDGDLGAFPFQEEAKKVYSW